MKHLLIVRRLALFTAALLLAPGAGDSSFAQVRASIGGMAFLPCLEVLPSFSAIVKEPKLLEQIRACVGLLRVLPLPGELGGFVRTEDKDPVLAVVLLNGRDATKEIFAASVPATQKVENDLIVGFFQGNIFVSAGKQGVAVKSADVAGFFSPDFRAELEKGRTIRIGPRSLTIPVADATTKKMVKQLNYSFTDHSTITWDPENRKPVWRGFSVRID